MSGLDYSLINAANYLPVLKEDTHDILSKYLEILMEIKELPEKKTHLFTEIRGLDTIFHVFCNVLSFTKNLQVAGMNARKAYLLYIDFTEQITEDTNLFLQLTTREAVQYVYKKTIYELNPNYVQDERDNLREVFSSLLCLKKLTEICFKQEGFEKMCNKFIQQNLKDDLLKKTFFIIEILHDYYKAHDTNFIVHFGLYLKKIKKWKTVDPLTNNEILKLSTQQSLDKFIQSLFQ